jgi:hypothetical protein
MKIFGDKNTFAIAYKADKKYVTGKKHAVPHCHFILNNQLIGQKGECCFLGTWASSLLSLRDKISQKTGCLTEPEFKELSDLEVFEMIEKSNQLEDEYKSEYLYLPKLPDDIWYKYNVRIDETIDRFSVKIIESNGLLKFLWRDCTIGDENLGIASTSHAHFIQVIDKCLDCLMEAYPSVIGHLKIRI